MNYYIIVKIVDIINVQNSEKSSIISPDITHKYIGNCHSKSMTSRIYTHDLIILLVINAPTLYRGFSILFTTSSRRALIGIP